MRAKRGAIVLLLLICAGIVHALPAYDPANTQETVRAELYTYDDLVICVDFMYYGNRNPSDISVINLDLSTAGRLLPGEAPAFNGAVSLNDWLGVQTMVPGQIYTICTTVVQKIKDELSRGGPLSAVAQAGILVGGSFSPSFNIITDRIEVPAADQRYCTTESMTRMKDAAARLSAAYSASGKKNDVESLVNGLLDALKDCNCKVKTPACTNPDVASLKIGTQGLPTNVDTLKASISTTRVNANQQAGREPNTKEEAMTALSASLVGINFGQVTTECNCPRQVSSAATFGTAGQGQGYAIGILTDQSSSIPGNTALTRGGTTIAALAISSAASDWTSTNPPVAVTAPADADRDGTADSDDKCTNTQGTGDLEGCDPSQREAGSTVHAQFTQPDTAARTYALGGNVLIAFDIVTNLETDQTEYHFGIGDSQGTQSTIITAQPGQDRYSFTLERYRGRLDINGAHEVTLTHTQLAQSAGENPCAGIAQFDTDALIGSYQYSGISCVIQRSVEGNSVLLTPQVFAQTWQLQTVQAGAACSPTIPCAPGTVCSAGVCKQLIPVGQAITDAATQTAETGAVQNGIVISKEDATQQFKQSIHADVEYQPTPYAMPESTAREQLESLPVIGRAFTCYHNFLDWLERFTLLLLGVPSAQASGSSQQQEAQKPVCPDGAGTGGNANHFYSSDPRTCNDHCALQNAVESYTCPASEIYEQPCYVCLTNLAEGPINEVPVD